jgi:hypothetical protein
MEKGGGLDRVERAAVATTISTRDLDVTHMRHSKVIIKLSKPITDSYNSVAVQAPKSDDVSQYVLTNKQASRNPSPYDGKILFSPEIASFLSSSVREGVWVGAELRDDDKIAEADAEAADEEDCLGVAPEPAPASNRNTCECE